MFVIRIIFISFILMTLQACHEKEKQSLSIQPIKPSNLEKWVAHTPTPHYAFTIIRSYPHDPRNFTEGFLMDEGYLYESAGLYQQSKLQKSDLPTGKMIREYSLPPQYFAEGTTIIGDQIYQLTYREHIGFVYDKNTFKLEKTFHYPTEGWGLTSDGKQLIMSDGSATLSFINPSTLTVTRKLTVTDQGHPISSLNELEYIHGKIYANIWPTDFIAILSPETGKVEGWINLRSLNTSANCKASICATNGIAYDEKTNTLLVTGKNWLHIYAIRLKK